MEEHSASFLPYISFFLFFVLPDAITHDHTNWRVAPLAFIFMCFKNEQILYVKWLPNDTRLDPLGGGYQLPPNKTTFVILIFFFFSFFVKMASLCNSDKNGES